MLQCKVPKSRTPLYNYHHRQSSHIIIDIRQQQQDGSHGTTSSSCRVAPMIFRAKNRSGTTAADESVIDDCLHTTAVCVCDETLCDLRQLLQLAVESWNPSWNRKVLKSGRWE
jgi:hypothetical protein